MSLTHKSRLKPGGPLRRRSKNPKAVTKLALGNRLSEWARAEGFCIYCGRSVGSENLHAHHIVTRGGDASLKLCPSNFMPLCGVPSGDKPSCHDQAPTATFNERLERQKPGLKSYLKLLGRTTWFKRDLDEVEAEIDRVTKRPWSEYWAELEVA